MAWLSRFSRMMFACLLLAAGGWVAMPVAKLFLHGSPQERPEPPRTPLDRRADEPPRHVIREAAPDEAAPSVRADAGWPADMIDFRPEVASEADGKQAAPPEAERPHVVFTAPTPPLPPLPQAFAFRPPPLDPTYRSTLEIPPPPLLDAHAPPPVSVARVRPDSRMPLSGDEALPGVPGQYVVCDGDDLTSIALKFYGNPAAAEAIWAANRDRLADPKLLPIGLSLHLPPAGSAGLPAGHSGRFIEPL